MSDSQRLHSHFLSMLQPALVAEDFRNVDVLAWALTGLLLQKTINLSRWSSSVASGTQAQQRVQRFRHWLRNSAVESRSWYSPFITETLRAWTEHSLSIALDTTQVTESLVVARTALLYRARAIPLAWQVYQRRSVMLAFEQYAELVEYTATLLPHDTTVTLLGDRGFRDIRLMQLARRLHWHFRLRLAENELVFEHKQGPSRNLDQWLLRPARPRFLQHVYLTQQRYGPVNVALVWDGDPTHDPWRIVTDQRASLRTLAEYAARMGIDAGFLDDKSAGFQLEDTELCSPRPLDHLLLVMALTSLYLVAAGSQLVTLKQRLLVDPHWQRGLSYAQLGWRWLDYLLACEAPLPIGFYLDPMPDPEPVPTESDLSFGSTGQRSGKPTKG